MDPIIDVSFANELIRFGTFVGWPGSTSQSAKPSALDLAKTGFYYKGQGDEVCCFSCNLVVQDWDQHHEPHREHATRSPHCPMVAGRASNNSPVVMPDDRERRAILNMLQQAGKRILSNVNDSSNNNSSLLINTLTALYGETMMRKRAPPHPPKPLTRSLSTSPRLSVQASRQAARNAARSPVARPPLTKGVATTHFVPQRRSSESEFDSSAGATATRPQFNRAQSYAPMSHPQLSKKTIANRQASTTTSMADHSEYQESEMARLKTFDRWNGIRGATAKEFAQAGFIFIGAPDRVQCVFCNGILRNWNDNDKPMEEHRKHFPNCSRVLETMSAVTTSQPRHLEYRTLDSREKSYEKWSRLASSTPAPQDLARAGFYYVGHGDSVKCFYCDGGLRNWEPNDDPWREHARWFPKCDYVKQSKGQPYVEAVLHETNLTEYQTASVDQTELKNVNDNCGASARREVDPREVTSRMDSAIVKTVLKMEVPKDRVRRAIKQRLADQGEDFSSAEALLEAVFNLDPSDPPQETAETTGSPSSDDEGERTDSNQSTDQDSMRLMEENRQLKEQKQCKICMDEEVCVAFLPCGHLVCCSTCAPALNTCPICRAKIRGTVRTYMA